MALNSLPEAVKVHIVQALACWDSPTVVAQSVNEVFGRKVSRQQVERYDPTKHAGRDLSRRFRDLFEETRAQFVRQAAEVGWGHQNTRLRVLQRVGQKAEAQGNHDVVLKVARQIAEETGGLLTNARIVKGALSISAPRTLADFYGGTLPRVVGQGEQ